MSTLPDSIPDRASARFLDQILARTRTDLTRRMQQTPRATLEQQALRHTPRRFAAALRCQVTVCKATDNGLTYCNLDGGTA